MTARWRQIVRRPWFDVAALLALLLLQGSVLRLDVATFTSDEGVYALEVGALADGGWTVDDPFLLPGDDPLAALPNVTVVGERVYPYVQHPLWPLALRAGDAIAGEAGMYAVPLVAAVLVPLVAWWAAGCLDPRWRRPAFWAAAASPAVVANGHVLWAHAASAALAGLALGAAIRCINGRTSFVAPLASATALGVVLRSEAVLFTIALVLALGGVALQRRSPRLAAVAVATATAGAVAVIVERVVHGRIVDRSLATLSSRVSSETGFLEGRLRGARVDLIATPGLSGAAVVALLGVAVLSAGAAGWFLLRDRPPTDLVTAGTVVGLVAYGAAWLLDPDAPVTGLLGAWPLAAAGAVGLVLVGRRAPVVLATAALFTVGVLGVNYSEGGGLQWGGRFLSPLTIPLAVALAALVCRWSDALPAGAAAVSRRTPVYAGAAAFVLAAGFFTTASRGTRAAGADVEDDLQGLGPDVVVTDNRFAAAVAWRTYDSMDWIVIDEERGRSLADAVDVAGAAGARCLAFVGLAEDEIEGVVDHLRPVGRVLLAAPPGSAGCP